VADRREMPSRQALVPPEDRPFLQFMYVGRHSTHLVRRLCLLFAAKARIISAYCAEIKQATLRNWAGIRIFAGMELGSLDDLKTEKDS
jgi:hypothetical protein